MASETESVNELAIKVKTLRGTLSPGAAAILDEVMTLAAASDKKSVAAAGFLVFRFKLVAVKTFGR